MAELAGAFETGSILIFTRTVRDAGKIAARLTKQVGYDAQGRIGILTGTLRGAEREALSSPRRAERDSGSAILMGYVMALGPAGAAHRSASRGDSALQNWGEQMTDLLLRHLPLLIIAGIAACASELERSAVRFSPYSEGAQCTMLRIPEAVTLPPSSGYSETLRAGSTCGSQREPFLKATLPSRRESVQRAGRQSAQDLSGHLRGSHRLQTVQRRAAFRGNAILEERMTKKQERSCS